MVRNFLKMIELHNFGIIEENRDETNNKESAITQPLERHMFMATQ